jgi:hypothetical protein
MIYTDPLEPEQPYTHRVADATIQLAHPPSLDAESVTLESLACHI